MGWGNFLNSVTGANSAMATQYKNQLKLQKDAQEFSKWQMGNAHQMEVEDLKKAGLNPALSAGGSGASAGVSMGSASSTGGNTNPVEMLGSIINMYNTVQQTKNNTAKTNADIQNEKDLTEAEVKKLDAETELRKTENKNQSADTQEKRNKEWWASTKWGKYVSPVLSDIGRIFGGAGYAAETTSKISSARAENRRKERGTTISTKR